MEIVFKYTGEILDEDIRQLTSSLVGYSRIDDKPIYNIEFNINRDLINDLLFNEFDKNNHVENIKMFLRRHKTNKILNNIIDEDMNKFASFVQYYNDNMIQVVVIGKT